MQAGLYLETWYTEFCIIQLNETKEATEFEDLNKAQRQLYDNGSRPLTDTTFGQTTRSPPRFTPQVRAKFSYNF